VTEEAEIDIPDSRHWKKGGGLKTHVFVLILEKIALEMKTLTVHIDFCKIIEPKGRKLCFLSV